MIRRFFATPRPPSTQRSCSLDGCDVIALGQRLLVPTWIGPCEIWLCDEHAAQLQRVRKAVATQIDDIEYMRQEREQNMESEGIEDDD